MKTEVGLSTPKPGRSPGEKFCHSCGETINKRAVICPKCGVPQQTTVEAPKSKLVAGVLGILLGSLGAHKFYLGQIGLGILYVVFSWTGIPALIGLIEGIIYLISSDKKWAERFRT